MICKEQLESAGIEFGGFVVSDNQMVSDTIGGKAVYHMSKIVQKYSNPGFILAVQPVNVDVIENILVQYSVENYCKPYVLDEYL